MILSTDGRRSFAIFLYARSNLMASFRTQIGFNAGDRLRMANVLPSTLQDINVFRIDGKSMRISIQVNGMTLQFVR